MKSPLFTIITVCYQAESVIEATIRSVLDQSFTDFEYIIVDGASTDGTNEIIKKYFQAVCSFRVRLHPADYNLYRCRIFL